MASVPAADRGLAARWQALCATSARSSEVGASLLARWSEPHRRYHDLGHLAAVLAAVDELAAHAQDLSAVRLAAWYHDAMYRGAEDDEERSALLAATELGPAGLDLDPATVTEVARLVRLTARHDPAPGDRNGAVLCDADLAVLGGDSAAYATYLRRVRQEYADVPEPAFRAGRAALLRRLLNRPWLFHSPTGRSRWESAARTNLSTELSTLAAATDLC